MFALYLQTGLGYTPLQSGLTVTSFALGAAASAVVGGRLVARWGRRLTVTGLALVVLGLTATAVILWVGPAGGGGLVDGSGARSSRASAAAGWSRRTRP